MPSKFPNFVVQVLRVKTVGGEKIRVTMSDGEYHCPSIYKSPDASVTSLTVGELIRVTNYTVYVLKDKPCVVFESFESLGVLPGKIGDPKTLTWKSAENESTESTTTTPQPVGAPTTTTITNNSNSNTAAAVPSKVPQTLPNNSAFAKMQGQKIIPISDIGPYSNNWVIKARVVNKSDIRHFNSKNGEGKLFNVTLGDQSGEIRATGFTDTVDKFYDLLQEGHSYYVSNGGLKIRNEKFNNVAHEYEMSFRRDTIIEKCDDDVKLPQVKYQFTSIADLQSKKSGDTADVIGVLKDVGQVDTATSRSTGRAYEKRDIYLVDQTYHGIRCTLWAKQAGEFSGTPGSVIALKGVKVSDFSGCSLSATPSSSMSLNPDITEAHSLKGWYDAAGENASFATLNGQNDKTAATSAARLTFKDVKDQGLGQNSKNDYFTLRGFVGMISRKSPIYPACVNSDSCRKKMQDIGGQYECISCNVRADTPFYRYSLSVQVSDATGAEFVSVFDEAAESLLGMKASEFAEIRDDENQVNAKLNSVGLDEYVFRIGARLDHYNDEARVRYSVFNAHPVKYESEAEFLLQEIEKYQ